MAAVQDPLPARPNIRIEIKNNLTEPEAMDVEEDIANENEDGEIVDDDDDNDGMQDYRQVQHQNELRSKGIFTTGINIFDKQTQEKLEERAKRFALKPEEIHSFTDTDLEELYESLGITNDVERITRFDTVHMYGINGLTTEDILEYFAKYAPTHIEWIDVDSCNVRWFENITAARAMFYSSKAVNGMPAREPVNTFAKEFLDDVEDDDLATGESILLKNRDVELRIEDILPNKVNLKNAVDISEITVRIPPGYWRLGEKHPKVKCLLLRYAFRTDKKPFDVIDLSRYYKKLGNLRIGGNSENGEQQYSEKGLLERNKDIVKEPKNPWGSLAKNWHKDRRFCEPDPNNAEANNEIEVKNPRFLLRLGKKPSAIHSNRNNDERDQSGEPEDDDDNESSRQSTMNTNKATGTTTTSTTRPMPRMRMYADEEEERQRRQRALQKLKRTEEMSTKENQHHHQSDLRNVLRHHPTTYDDVENDEDNNEATTDLGARLKNRTQRMVFTVRRGDEQHHHQQQQQEDDDDDRIDRRDARRVLQARRRHHHQQTGREPPSSVAAARRERSPYSRSRRRDPSLERYTLSSHRSLHDRKRSHPSSISTKSSSLHQHRRGHMRSDYIDTINHKPMSKVAVVIKKPKQPVVASTIWSKVKRSTQSESEDGDSSSSDDDDNEDDEDTDNDDASSASDNSSSSSSSTNDEEEDSKSDRSSNHSDDGDRRKRRLQIGGGLRSQSKSNTRLRITATNMRNNHYGSSSSRK